MKNVFDINIPSMLPSLREWNEMSDDKKDSWIEHWRRQVCHNSPNDHPIFALPPLAKCHLHIERRYCDTYRDTKKLDPRDMTAKPLTRALVRRDILLDDSDDVIEELDLLQTKEDSYATRLVIFVHG